jgi:hypothetical protein
MITFGLASTKDSCDRPNCRRYRRPLVRNRWPGKRVFTYWDYRAGMFHQDLGMRIDLVLATGPVAERVRAAWVDRHARKGSGPSDHAPVIVDLDEAPDGDIGPVVPPPSAPATRKVPCRRAADAEGPFTKVVANDRLESASIRCRRLRPLSGEESFSIFAY